MWLLLGGSLFSLAGLGIWASRPPHPGPVAGLHQDHPAASQPTGLPAPTANRPETDSPAGSRRPQDEGAVPGVRSSRGPGAKTAKKRTTAGKKKSAAAKGQKAEPVNTVIID